jgi:phenylacetic acid degradation operon negative regulatory protein
MSAISKDLLDAPLSPRSLIASLLLRSPAGGMPGARLVHWCELFGVAEGTARVAMSRMVERGELRARDGVYALAGRVGERRPAQDWSLAPRLRDWDGSWSIAIVRGGARAASARGALRDAMRRARLAELREGVWTRPDNLPRAATPDEAWHVIDDQCTRWTGSPDADADDVALARELFDPDGWARRADRLRVQLARVTAEVDRRLGDAFVVGAAAVAHVRRDPLLPPQLGPSGEAGGALRAAYRDYEAAFSHALRAWFRAHA